MREKFMRFMYSRYGIDQFSKFLLWLTLGMIIISTFFRFRWLDLLAVLLIGYMYFRVFSKNIRKRYEENNKFLQIKGNIFWVFKNFKRDMTIRKTHHIYKCPNCSQKIKIPKGKGKVAIRCPKCYTEFIKHS